jgi:hypothetical protein
MGRDNLLNISVQKVIMRITKDEYCAYHGEDRKHRTDPAICRTFHIFAAKQNAEHADIGCPEKSNSGSDKRAFKHWGKQGYEIPRAVDENHDSQTKEITNTAALPVEERPAYGYERRTCYYDLEKRR